MRNPLNKRLPREFLGELGKYLVILILLVATIGMVSGFLVADGSMIKAYNDSFEKYNIEDGHFETAKRLNKAQIKAVTDLGVSLYDISYTEKAMEGGTTIRFFKVRDEVDLACLMAGEMPQTADEVVLDRMFADNNELKVGDQVTIQDGKTCKISGLVAMSDYSTMFQDNNDTMFDAVKFGVAAMTEAGFEDLGSDGRIPCYAWKYNDPPADDAEANERGEDFMKALVREVPLENFIPRYANQAIIFTGEDMGGDRGMMITLLYIIIVIMAFVFAVTISSTISKEASVIGVLRASGYTRGELLGHYMLLPMLVSLIGAVIGNILGYTVMKGFMAGLYYNSYSLPTYETIWSGEAFLLTTVVPLLMMTVINFLMLRSKLGLPPLKFLRHDLSRRKQKRALRLSYHLPFFSRYRLRILFQNVSNYLVLLIGIAFANLLLMFGMGLPEVLRYFQTSLEENLTVDYQYMLTVPLEMSDDEHKLKSMLSMLQFARGVETENEDAEKFSANSLKTCYERSRPEDVTLYGIEPDSRYLPMTLSDEDVYITSAYADKYSIAIGDTVTLKERYSEDTYDFKVTGIYDFETTIAVYMSRTYLNRVFDYEEDFFCGYFSDTPITDIDEKYIGSVIDIEDLSKVSRQLQVSMGSMMYMVDGFAILLFFVLIYLLSKIIIEKNAQSISMSKILGYNNREIARLYLLPTSLVVVLCLLGTQMPVFLALKQIFRILVRESMTGWFPLKLRNIVFVRMFLMGLAAYVVVAFLEYRRIVKVPMDMVLKNVE